LRGDQITVHHVDDAGTLDLLTLAVSLDPFDGPCDQ